MFPRPRKIHCLLIPLFILFVLGLILLVPSYQYRLRTTLSYATRPLWDRADGPRLILPHYYSDGMPMDSRACALHGWAPRQTAGEMVRVLDAVLMSSELDLLEVRLHELEPVVDRFFIVESNATFTGLLKPAYFSDNRERFAAFEDKIEYHFLPSYTSTEGQPVDAWAAEAATRDFMAEHLRAYIAALPPGTETLVLMSDVDELPARHTLSLLRACDFGSALHLLMRNYLYSFEWYLGMSSWRASVHRFSSPPPRDSSGGGDGREEEEVFYRHSLTAPTALSDAGWHCSFCFRTLPEYTAKMRGFSHSDRIGGDERLLDEDRIQAVICEGSDIFGMLPEAYSYGDLLSQLYLRPSRSAVHLPEHILGNADRYAYLLPGGCMRDRD